MHTQQEISAFCDMVVSHSVKEAAPFAGRETVMDGMHVNMLGLLTYRYIADTTNDVAAAASALADYERRVAAVSESALATRH